MNGAVDLGTVRVRFGGRLLLSRARIGQHRASHLRQTEGLAQFDWLPHRGNVAEATERLIEKHNPDWNLGGGTGLHPDYVHDVAVAGFDDIETFSFDVPVSYSHEAWRGRIRASAGVAASLGPDRVARFDAELADLLTAYFPRQLLQIPDRVFAVISRSP